LYHADCGVEIEDKCCVPSTYDIVDDNLFRHLEKSLLDSTVLLPVGTYTWVYTLILLSDFLLLIRCVRICILQLWYILNYQMSLQCNIICKQLIFMTRALFLSSEMPYRLFNRTCTIMCSEKHRRICTSILRNKRDKWACAFITCIKNFRNFKKKKYISFCVLHTKCSHCNKLWKIFNSTGMKLFSKNPLKIHHDSQWSTNHIRF